MILSFNQERFKHKILEGSKIHSMRLDMNNRWKAGKAIEMWHNSPFNKKANPHEFIKSKVVSTQKVRLYRYGSLFVAVDDRPLTTGEIKELAINDGFDTVNEFAEYFVPVVSNGDPAVWEGKIIHWTDKRY